MSDPLPSNSGGPLNGQIEIECECRWQIYQRLQDLCIPCEYKLYAPLKVQIDHPVQALQLWSVLQSLTMTRQALAERLEACWNLRMVRGNESMSN